MPTNTENSERAAEPPQKIPSESMDVAGLLERVKPWTQRSLIIYESTNGDTTRKVLADDALLLQQLLRDAAAALESLERERDLLRAQVSNLESAVEYWRAGRDATPT